AAAVRVREALDELATGALRRLATAQGLSAGDAATRSELLERLVERLSEPGYLADQLAALPEAERAVLAEVRAAGGQSRGFLLEKRHPGALDRLTARGLVFRTFTAAGPRRGEVFQAPEEVLDL